MDKQFKEACLKNELKTIKRLINDGENLDWNWGMMYAAEGGHNELVNLFIEKGANNWNWGMDSAAESGQKDLVEFFIEKGANDWNRGMSYAAKGGHKDLVEFFIEKGANNFDDCLRLTKNKEIYLLLIDKKGIDKKTKWICEREVKRALQIEFGREIIEKRIGIGGEAKYLLDEFF